MSIYLTIWTITRICIVAFFAGVAFALAVDDDRGTFDEPAEVHEQRRRIA